MTEVPENILLLPKDAALFGQKYGHPDVQQVHVGDESVQYVRKDVADLARPVTVAELEQTRVGDIGNRYGGISIRCIDGKPEWAIEDYDGLYWEPCPIPVFLALRALSHEGGE